MNWHRKDRYAEVSECGRYSVCAIGLGEGRYVFEGWRTRAHRDGPHLICANVTADHARKLCEEDAADAQP